MTDIGKAGTFRLGDRKVNRMGYGAMQLPGPGVFGPPRDHHAGARRAPRGGGGRGRSHRHQRLLRAARLEPADPRGAVALSGRSRHRHQGRRRAAATMPRGSRPSSRRTWLRPCTTICATSAWKPIDVVNLRAPGDYAEAGRRDDRPPVRGAGRAAAPGADPPSRSQQRHRQPDRRSAGDCARSSACRTTTIWCTATMTL